MQPTPGRIVNFVIPDGPLAGEIRPAMIVRVWDNELCNLHVFSDGPNDHETTCIHGNWVGSVNHSEKREPRTWHWPARVEASEPAALAKKPRKPTGGYAPEPSVPTSSPTIGPAPFDTVEE